LAWLSPANAAFRLSSVFEPLSLAISPPCLFAFGHSRCKIWWAHGGAPRGVMTLQAGQVNSLEMF
jgi:hypothetical protein